MTKPHKHAEAIKAWADGKQIQWAEALPPTAADPLAQREPGWFDVCPGVAPMWAEHHLYRAKPEPKWQKEREAFYRGERIQWRSLCAQHAKHGWMDVPPGSPLMGPAFDEPTNEFRVPREWQAERDAFDRGKEIEVRSNDFGWTATSNPSWLKAADGYEYRAKPKAETIRRCLIRNIDGSVRTGNAKTESAEKALEARSDFLMWCGPRKEVVTESKPIVAFGVDPGAAGGDEGYFVARMADGTIQHWKFR